VVRSNEWIHEVMDAGAEGVVIGDMEGQLLLSVVIAIRHFVEGSWLCKELIAP